MSRKSTPLKEQYRLVMECRQSGLTDALWCQQNGIRPGTFYNWTARLRKKGCEVPQSACHEDFVPTPRQDVVRVDLVPDSYHSTSDDAIVYPVTNPLSSNIKLEINGTKLEIPNGIDMNFLSQVIRVVKDSIC